MSDLAAKLAMAKKFMDKHDELDGKKSGRSFVSDVVNEYDEPINVKYDLGDIDIETNYLPSNPAMMEAFSSVNITKPVSDGITEDKIKNTKLPDEIKRMLLEHPPVTPQSNASASLDADTIRKARSLMGENSTTAAQSQKPQKSVNLNGDIKSILKEVVKEVLQENGLLLESERSSKEKFKFRIGNHLFIGNIEKIKKFTN